MSELEIRSLSTAFGGVQAVREVSFTVGRGEFVAMIGPNGAGKSTCFNMINGQLPPDSGEILFEGRDLARRRPRDIWRLGVGRTFQVAATFGSMTAAEQPAHELAYGDVKRVELAIALANDPRLLLMDEPTAGMAPRERNELVALVKQLVIERRISVLFTEHSMDVVFAFADRIIVLARGRLIADGTVAAIRDDARVREVYFGTGKTFAEAAR